MTEYAEFDIVIVGGGMVGGTLACVLAQKDLRIALIEAFPFKSNQQPSYDDRSIALAYGSKIILENCDLWAPLSAHATPIKQIHVSDRGHFGFTRINSNSSPYNALGYVIENRAMGQVFAETLSQQTNITLFCPSQLRSLDIDMHHAQATIRTGDRDVTIKSRLIIGADGSQSTVRQLCNIANRCWDYGQTAIITNISTEKDHNNCAYERFTSSGPLALLPMSQQRCSVVWTVRNQDLEKTLALSDDAFLQQLQQQFGYRLGLLKQCGKRSSYPLQLMRPDHDSTERVVLIGNAAHTLHPIAGQGFNLGIRDVAVLAEILTDALDQGRDIGTAKVLDTYKKWRQSDQRTVSFMTDSLVRVFSNDFPPLVLARNIGLLAMDILPPLKNRLAKQAMGLSGRLPRLSRGLPL